MFQFIAIMVIMGSIIVRDRIEVGKQKRWLQEQYDRCSVTGDSDGAMWYATRLSRIKYRGD